MFSSSALYLEDIDYIANLNLDWGQFKNSNILITGATGLIGTVLVDTLLYKNNKDHLNIRVFALSRSQDRLQSHFASYYNRNNFFVPVVGDVSEELGIKSNIDFVVNLASNTHPVLYATKPIMTIDSIVSGTKTILNFAASHHTKRVIIASSVEIYGKNRGDVERFTEDYCGYIDCNTLRAGYPEGKRLSEALSQAFITEKGIDVIAARLGRVYGATLLDSDTKGTTQFIRNTVNGDDVVLKSEGSQEYSYVYVADAVAALLVLLLEGRCGEAYNISNSEIKTLRETAEILAAINRNKVVFEVPSENEQKGFSVVQRALMDSTKIEKLGWVAKYDLKSGLERTIQILKNAADAQV